jgi:hypothetical protein
VNRVFISYRISDCPDLVGRLDDDLARALGRDAVFFDKERLRGGQEWPAELEVNARSCSIMLAMIGPAWQTAAFKDDDRLGFPRLSDSQDWVRREIHLSLDAGNVVFPVYMNGAKPPSRNWLARCGLGRLFGKQGVWLNTDDYRSHLNRLLEVIREYCPELKTPGDPVPKSERRDFYLHVALPPFHVERGPELAKLISVLLTDHNTVALTSGGLPRPVALHGMGGIGKSVLARAVCDEPQVQAAFPDGILWTTLGPTPNLKTCLREWLGALGATVSGATPTINRLLEALAGALASRSCLLIVDDLWEADHLHVFAVRGPRCQLLVTTRNASLTGELAARIHPVNSMAADEALRLLETWADKKLDGEPSVVKQAILARLGGLPLAIKLAGAYLQRNSAQEWLTSIAGAQGLDATLGEVDDKGIVAGCLRLSMNALDEPSRSLFAALGIFRENEPIPLVAVTKLWSERGATPQTEARWLCNKLAEHALVELVRDRQALVLHDLVRQMLIDRLGDQHIEAHRSILAAYARTRSGSNWATAADDGYLYDHLTYHLAGAQDLDGLRRLFDDPDWMWARLRHSDYRLDGYLGDLDRFWKLATRSAHGQIDADGSPDALVDCLGCALIQTTLNSGTNTYPPLLVARAVELGLWSVDRALSTLERVPDEGRRFDGLSALLGLQTLTPEARHRVTAIALGFEHTPVKDGRSVERLGRLGAVADRAHLAEILELILHSDGVTALPEAIAAILPRMAENQFDAILDAAGTLPAEHLAYAPRHQLLATIAPHLPERLLERALGMALETRSHGRISSLVAFLPKLEPPRRDAIIDLAWNEALAMPPAYPPDTYDDIRARAFAQLARFLSAERRQEASLLCLHDVQGMQDADDIREIVETFAGWFAAEDLAEVVRVVRTLGEPGSWWRLSAIAHLAGRLHEAGIDEPIDDMVHRVFEDGRWGGLVCLLPDDWRTKCVARLLADAHADHGRIAMALLPALPPREKEVVLRSGKMTSLLEERDIDWNQVAGDLPRAMFDELVDAMIAFPDTGGKWPGGGVRKYHGYYTLRESRLMQVASRLSAEQVQRCLIARGRIRDELWLTRLIVSLRPWVRVPAQAVEVALKVVQCMPEEDEDVVRADPPLREMALAALASHLSVDHLATCLADIERGNVPLTQIFGLAALLPHLRDATRDQALRSARSKVTALQADADQHALAMALMIPTLAEADRPAAARDLLVKLGLGDEKPAIPEYELRSLQRSTRGRKALELVIGFLHPDQLRRLALQIREVDHPFGILLVDVVRAWVPHMTHPEAREFEEFLRTHIPDDLDSTWNRHYLARLELVPRLAPQQGDAIVAFVLDRARRQIASNAFIDSFYVEVISSLPVAYLGAEVERVCSQESAVRPEILSSLIPRIEGALQQKAMKVFLEDILALDGLQAFTRLGSVSHVLVRSSDHRWLLRRELTSRLHHDRTIERDRLLSCLVSSGLLSDALLPDSVLSAFATRLLAVVHDWAWP